MNGERVVYGAGVENIPWRAAKDDRGTSLRLSSRTAIRGNARVRPGAQPRGGTFFKPSLLPNTHCVGRVWRPDTWNRPPRKPKGTLHQLKQKPVKKHQTNGVAL